MTRGPDKPFLDNAATWNPRKKRLTVTIVREVDSGIKSVALNLSSGDVNIRGIVPQVSAPVPASELTTQLVIRARTEEKAREMLARQGDKVKITTSPEGVAVTQEADTSIPTRKEQFLSSWRLLVDLWKGREIDFSLLGRNPKLDVSLQAPGEEILYELNTNYGNIRVVDVRGKEGSAANTRTGDVYVGRSQGDFNATSGYGSMRVSEHKGDLTVRTETGEVMISAIEGDTHARTGYGDLILDNIKGDAVGHTVTGSIDVTNVDGKAHVETGYGDIEAKQVTKGLHASTTTGNITGEHLSGNSDLSSGYGDIYAADVNGSLDVSTVTGNIEVQGISGSIHAETGYGEVDVTNADLHGMNNRVAATTGNIQTSVLNDNLIVHAVSRTGDFQTSGLQIDRDSGDDWTVNSTAYVGSGISKNRIELVTGYGDIYVTKR
ncbi:MAG: DUF4097 family beta strand repeat-containing protein [Candidatus Levyibacteriota bacterium]